MRLVHRGYGIEICICENIINIVTVENRIAFRKMVGELWEQCNGGTGDWILSQQGKELMLDSICEVIFNPYAISVNDKKMIAALYKQLIRIVEEECYTETLEMNSQIVSFLDEVLNRSDYPVIYDLELNMNSIFKSYNVRFDEEKGVDGIIDYMKLRHQVLGISLFVWINGKQFFDEKEYEEVHKFANYEKINIIIFEGVETKRTAFEDSMIIDHDLCII